MRSQTRLTSLTVFALVAALASQIAADPAHGANWLLLQGVQAENRPTTELWGFVHGEYQETADEQLRAGAWAGQGFALNQVRPRARSSARTNLLRARVGLRGRACFLSCNIHYFALGELGYNGLTLESTQESDWEPVLTDLSATFRLPARARIRAGMFKYPGGEEGFQGVQTFDYINFTGVTDFLVLERIARSAGSGTPPNGGLGDGFVNDPRNSAFRDFGVQIFDVFRLEKWEVSYAAMIGNGNGSEFRDNDHRKDLYLYGSFEKVLSGAGPLRQGRKLYAWYQNGNRKLSADDSAVYERDRWGIGAISRKGPLRLGFEYVGASGMIFSGTDGGAVPGARSNSGLGVASFNFLTDDRASGWYADLGYRFLPSFEFDLRLDQLQIGTKALQNERHFETLTAGVKYSFRQRPRGVRNLRLIFNYEFRSAEAPRLPAGAVPNQILSGLDDRFGIQVQAIF